MDEPCASLISPMPSIKTTTAMPTPSQIQNFLLLRDAATKTSQGMKKRKSPLPGRLRG
jgi:hypothetical protein